MFDKVLNTLGILKANSKWRDENRNWLNTTVQLITKEKQKMEQLHHWKTKKSRLHSLSSSSCKICFLAFPTVSGNIYQCTCWCEQNNEEGKLSNKEINALFWSIWKLLSLFSYSQPYLISSIFGEEWRE